MSQLPQHRVGRVLSFFSSRRNWDSPNPSSPGECAPPPPPVMSGGAHSLGREGLGVSQFRRGDILYTVVLFIYMHVREKAIWSHSYIRTSPSLQLPSADAQTESDSDNLGARSHCLPKHSSAGTQTEPVSDNLGAHFPCLPQLPSTDTLTEPYSDSVLLSSHSFHQLVHKQSQIVIILFAAYLC